jgi:protein TonB
MTAGAPADDLELAKERVGFTAFLSLCLHAILILGVGFTFSAAPEITTLDITLTTDIQAQAPRAPASEAQQATATAAPAADTAIPDEAPQLDATTPPQTLEELRAQLELRRQEYAERPRRYTLTSTSAKDTVDTAYLNAWQARIEQVGNQNYPQAATDAGIYGTLRLLVAINPDGSIEGVRILRSSGEPILDQAALRIVQMAAPFAPLSDKMRERMDVLEVIRTWQFQRGATFSSF